RLEGLGGRLDDQVDALVEQVEPAVGHQAGNLDEGIAFDVEPCHLAVDPDEPVVHPHKSRTSVAVRRQQEPFFNQTNRASPPSTPLPSCPYCMDASFMQLQERVG